MDKENDQPIFELIYLMLFLSGIGAAIYYLWNGASTKRRKKNLPSARIIDELNASTVRRRISTPARVSVPPNALPSHNQKNLNVIDNLYDEDHGVNDKTLIKQSKEKQSENELKTAMIRETLIKKREERKLEKIKSNDNKYKLKENNKNTVDIKKSEIAAINSNMVEEKINKRVILKPCTTVFFQKSEKSAAKSQLIEYAIKLLEFNPIKATSLADKNINQLAFIYHFHRYNLARLILSINKERELSVEFRNLAVHIAKHSDAEIFDKVIRDTYHIMKRCLYVDVISLLQQSNAMNHRWYGSNQQLKTLKDLSDVNDNWILFENNHDSFSELPMPIYWQELFHTVKDETQLSHQVLKERIDSYFNVMNIINSSQASDKYHRKSAMKMLILIMGDYLDYKNMPDSYRKKFNELKHLRNKLAHRIEEVSDDEMDKWLPQSVDENKNSEPVLRV